ncbi:hypothetical protein SETIT_2G226000v2 [Setaria italica]|uniref:Uncharacterized protein n=1 Tax=Setaria italica TaxID=4555 RepID=A0A368Q1K4_SETIT|nr:hypothetical protein SETIT_2G226000v2 [Setaria italica]
MRSIKSLEYEGAFGTRRWRDGPQDSLNGSCYIWLIFNVSYQKTKEQSDPTKSTSTSEARRMLKDHVVRHVERRSCTRRQLENSV